MLDPAKAIAAFPDIRSATANQVQQIESEDGFSGSLLWKISRSGADYLLRCWPSETSRDRIEWIHQVQSQVRESGFQFTPQLFQSENQQTLAQVDGRFWELAAWMPGTSISGLDQTEPNLRRMFELLAQFHQHSAKIAAATLNQTGHSSTVRERIDMIEYFNTISREQFTSAVQQTQWNDFITRAVELLNAYQKHSQQIMRELNSVKDMSFKLQPCLRDARGEHFLFEAGKPSGLIDYGAMRIESVAVDLARLSSTTIRSNANLQQDTAIAHYERIQPLSSDEKLLVSVLLNSSRYLTGMNWIRWVALEKREFGSSNGVIARLDTALEQLESTP
ncbi:MAG: phosphotransferase enzyme family protein [Pirellulales bacterium]|jgi:Ser/Thr protein kinase RdoA (MazF antagonist)